MLVKEFKAEVKSWKKDLGIEIKEKINLEKKLDALKQETEDKQEKATTAKSPPRLSSPTQRKEHPDHPTSNTRYAVKIRERSNINYKDLVIFLKMLGKMNKLVTFLTVTFL